MPSALGLAKHTLRAASALLRFANRYQWFTSALIIASAVAYLVASALFFSSPKAHAASPKVIFLTTTGSNQTWNVPADWNSSNNTIEAIGPGFQGVSGGSFTGFGGAGSGGGAYAKTVNLNLIPGGTAKYTIAAANTGAATWLSNTGSSPTTSSEGVLAVGGTSGSIGGGAAASCVGTVTHSGGNGGPQPNLSGGTGGSGGGAGGPTGDGSAGTNGGGGTPGGAAGPGGGWTQTSDGATAAPGAGGQYAAGVGANYGGGGGGGQPFFSGSGFPGGSGGPSIIVITYTPIAHGSSSNFIVWEF